MTDRLIGYDELARMLGIKKGTAYSWVSRGQIPHVRISGRLVRFDPAMVKAWLKEREVPTAPGHDDGGAMVA